MAKSSSGAGGDGSNETRQGGGEETGDRIQQQIRDFAQKAADLAQNPVARTMIAAGLVTAAAAMTSNKKVRDNVKKAGRDAADSAEEAAEAASRIGTAVVNAAADAFRRVMNLGSAEEEDAGGSSGSGDTSRNVSAKAKSGSKAKGSSGGAAKSAGGASKAKTAGGNKSKGSGAGAGGRAKPSASSGGAARKRGGSGASGGSGNGGS